MQDKNQTADGTTEEALMQALAKDVAVLLQRRAGADLIVYLNRPEWSLEEIVEDSNRRAPLLHVALHSNAGGGSGTETWCYGLGTTRSCKFGRLLQDKVVAALGLPDRGTKNGEVKNFAEIVHVKATSVICELFFYDRAEDLSRFYDRRPQVVEAIAAAVLGWFDLRPDQRDEFEFLRSENAKLRQALTDAAQLIAAAIGT